MDTSRSSRSDVNKKNLWAVADHVYRKSGTITVQWQEMLDQDIYQFLDSFSKNMLCPLDFVVASLIPCISMAAGPRVRMDVLTGYWSINSYFFLIGAPTTGKSTVYKHIIQEFSKGVEEIIGANPIVFANYSMEGIHDHQSRTHGYGLIASPEGKRFMSTINKKQQLGDPSKAFICSLWDGSGEGCTTLSGKERSFNNTSMSICQLVQPESLLQELPNLLADDGFVERILFLSTIPYMPLSDEIQDNKENYNERYGTDRAMYSLGKMVAKGFYDPDSPDVVFHFDDEAGQFVNNLYNEMAAKFNKKWHPEAADSTLNPEEMEITDRGSQTTQVLDRLRHISSAEDNYKSSSKEIQVVVRLSAVLHLLAYGIRSVLENETFEPPTSIPLKCAKAAHDLYTTCNMHKGIFIEAVMCNETIEPMPPKATNIKSVPEKVMHRVVTSMGPFVRVTTITHTMSGTASSEIKFVLQQMADKGYGRLVKKAGNQWTTEDLFFKTVPGEILQAEGKMPISLREYKNNFFTFLDEKEEVMRKYLPHHHQWEKIPKKYREQYSPAADTEATAATPDTEATAATPDTEATAATPDTAATQETSAKKGTSKVATLACRQPSRRPSSENDSDFAAQGPTKRIRDKHGATGTKGSGEESGSPAAKTRRTTRAKKK